MKKSKKNPNQTFSFELTLFENIQKENLNITIRKGLCKTIS